MRTIRDGNCTNSWKLTRNIYIPIYEKDFISFAINKAFCSFFRCYIHGTNKVTFLIV